MTKDEAVIVSAYTGYMLCEVDELIMYATKVMGCLVDRHDLSSPVFEAKLRIKSHQDYINLEVK